MEETRFSQTVCEKPEIRRVVVQWPQSQEVKRVFWVSERALFINAAAREGANIIYLLYPFMEKEAAQ